MSGREGQQGTCVGKRGSAQGRPPPLHLARRLSPSRQVHASEVVRFVNRRADARGFHSLIQAAPGEGLRSRSGPGYTLPPFATVVLERVDAPGEWRLYGKEMRCRLFTCSVTYSL